MSVLGLILLFLNAFYAGVFLSNDKVPNGVFSLFAAFVGMIAMAVLLIDLQGSC